MFFLLSDCLFVCLCADGSASGEGEQSGDEAGGGGEGAGEGRGGASPRALPRAPPPLHTKLPPHSAAEALLVCINVYLIIILNPSYVPIEVHTGADSTDLFRSLLWILDLL